CLFISRRTPALCSSFVSQYQRLLGFLDVKIIPSFFSAFISPLFTTRKHQLRQIITSGKDRNGKSRYFYWTVLKRQYTNLFERPIANPTPLLSFSLIKKTSASNMCKD